MSLAFGGVLSIVPTSDIVLELPAKSVMVTE